MLVINRGIVIIMTNSQKTVFPIKKLCIYAKIKKIKKMNTSQIVDNRSPHTDNVYVTSLSKNV